MGKQMLLAVDVAEGMFPNERAVTLHTVKGDVSCFVTADKVDIQSPGRGVVVVDVLDYDEDYGLVELPSQTGAKFAKVARSALTLVK